MTSPVSTVETRMYKEGANHQRTKDPDGHVALRVARLLRGGRDRVKANVGEENRGRAGSDPSKAELPRTLCGRNEGMPVHPAEFRVVKEVSLRPEPGRCPQWSASRSR